MRHHAAARLAHHVSDEGDDQEDPLYRLLPDNRKGLWKKKIPHAVPCVRELMNL
jgi:hypothetical protein